MSSRVQGKIEVLQAVNERNDPVDNDFEPEKDFLERIVDRSEDAVEIRDYIVQKRVKIVRGVLRKWLRGRHLHSESEGKTDSDYPFNDISNV